MKKTKKVPEKLTSSMEDYLETVAVLKSTEGVARVKDISRLMNVKRPSVTGALNVLSRMGLVVHEKYGYVDLTEEGREAAQVVKKKHDVLIKFLTGILGIKKEAAAKDACRMEHSVSPESFEKLTKFMEFVETNSGGGTRPRWLENFEYYLKTGKTAKCSWKKYNRKETS